MITPALLELWREWFRPVIPGSVYKSMTMTHFDSSGRQVSRVDYRAEREDREYDVGEILDRGIMPDFEKDELDGETVTFVGIKGPEDFQLGPVYFVLIKRAEHPAEMDAYGIMFAATSPIIATVMAMAEKGHLPFRAQLVKAKSQSNRGYEYWMLRRPTGQPATQAVLPNPGKKQEGKAPATA